jgi:hypothetical protein
MLKKLKNFSMIILASGASLVVGLLSFGGFYALWPIWPLALASFFLSVIYEGEIFKKTILGAFKKISKKDTSLKNVTISIFSIIAAVLMTIGGTFLLTETITAIPFLANIALFTNPILLGALAILGGISYGLLTYNALYNFTVKNKFQKTWAQIKQNFLQKKFLSGVMTGFFLLLTIGLTICTAGTWLTIARQGRSAINFLNSLPFFIMGILQPVFTGIASLAFNFLNIIKSINLIERTFTEENFNKTFNAKKTKFLSFFKNNNWKQIINPLNIIVFCLKQPLIILGFIGHLVSIAMTSDRVPGIAPIYSAVLGFINEFVEDLHFFFNDKDDDHDHKHEKCHHNHEKDLPKIAIDALFRHVEHYSDKWHRFFASPTNQNEPDTNNVLNPQIP